MPERMPIGTDLRLLCDAAKAAVRYQRASPAMLQRRVRVGWVKAMRLMVLLEDYGIIGRPSPRGEAEVLIRPDQLPGVLAKLKEASDEETGRG